MYKYHLIITLASFITLSTIPMELSPEQKQDAQNWFKAYQEQSRTWEIFDKTPAGIQCEQARMLHKKNPSSDTDLLINKALDNALKTKEFNDFFQAKTIEIALRNELVETDKSRERKLVGTQGYAAQKYEMNEYYDTLFPIHPEYSTSERAKAVACTLFIDDENQ